MDFINFKNKYQKKEVQEVKNTAPENPVVSVCVQTYQHKNYIAQCLDGILMQQTDFPFEILLGDDDSSDGTREICLEYAQKYPGKIRLFLHHRENNIKINGNPTGRFNFLYNLFSAKGEYIALCEGDDYWTNPLKLQKQVDFLGNNPDFGICFHEVAVFNQALGKIYEDSITRKVPAVTDISDLARGNYIHTPSVVLKNDFAIPSWFTKSSMGDWTLYMIAVKNKKIKKHPAVMGVYRVHNSGIWTGMPSKKRISLAKNSFELVESNLKLSLETKAIIRRTIDNYILDLIAHSRSFKILNILKRYLKS